MKKKTYKKTRIKVSHGEKIPKSPYKSIRRVGKSYNTRYQGKKSKGVYIYKLKKR